MTLTNIIKQILGRQLSQEDIERAKKGFEISREDFKKKYSIDKDIYSNEESIEIITTHFEHITTPDVSYGWKNPHMGWYPRKIKTEMFTMDGLLKEKSVIKGNVAHPIWGHAMAIIDYNPAGRIFGKAHYFSRSQ